MFVGCGDKKESSETQTKIEMGSIDSMKDKVEDIEKNMEELKKATPLSNEQLKALLPEKLDGMKRKSYNITKMGFNAVEAKYDDDIRSISLSILDGAGEAGAGMISMAEFGMNAGGESESEDGYKKPLSVDGTKGFEEQERSSDGSNITNKVTFIVKHRFILTFEAQGIEMDKLKSIVEESKLIDSLEDAQ